MPSTANLPNSNHRKALILNCQKVLFGAYRIDQFADAEVFKNSVGAVLEQYPDEVIMSITNPRTGIQRRIKFPPTVNEIVEACEEQLVYLDRMRRPKRLPVEQIPPPRLREMAPGELANIFVPEDHKRYPALVEWAETAEPVLWKYEPSSDGRRGIWVANGIWDTGRL